MVVSCHTSCAARFWFSGTARTSLETNPLVPAAKRQYVGLTLHRPKSSKSMVGILCDRWLVFFHPDIFRRFNVIGIVHVYGHGQPLLQQFRETLVPHLDFMVMGPWVLRQAKHLKRLTPRYAVSKETLEELQNKQHSALQWSYCSVRLGQWLFSCIISTCLSVNDKYIYIIIYIIYILW